MPNKSTRYAVRVPWKEAIQIIPERELISAAKTGIHDWRKGVPSHVLLPALLTWWRRGIETGHVVIERSTPDELTARDHSAKRAEMIEMVDGILAYGRPEQIAAVIAGLHGMYDSLIREHREGRGLGGDREAETKRSVGRRRPRD